MNSIPLSSRLALVALRQLARLPLSWLHRVGGAGGRLVYRLSGKMRGHLLENVRRAGIVGSGDERALRRFALTCASELGKGALEILPVWFGRPEDIMNLVRVDDSWSRVEPLIAAGKGVIFLTPHLGGFEVAAQFAANRVPLTIMYRPPRMAWLRPVFRHGRSRGFAQLTTADNRGVRALLRALRRGEAIGLLPDQVPAQGHGVDADFFGRPAYTTTLIGRLQQATGAAIVVVRMRRLPAAAGFDLSFFPIAKPLASDDAAAARALNALQEDIIRTCPEQYLWSYNRFKAPIGAKPHSASSRLARLLPDMLTHLALALIWLTHKLPFYAIAKIGRGIGWLGYWLVVPRRIVVAINLKLSFPELAEKDRIRLAKRHFSALGRAMLERGILWYAPRERILRFVRFEGVEHFEAVRGQPVMLLAPHFVGLDMGGTRVATEWKAASMYGKQKNPALDRAMRRGRERFGDPILVSRQDGIRPVVRAIRDGFPFYYLPDADLGPKESIFVPFFGVQTATVPALSRLAQVSRARIVPIVTRQLPDGQGYVARFYPAWDDFPTGDVEADTRRMNEFIEARVREMPEQYYWVHKRFKTRPPGEARFY